MSRIAVVIPARMAASRFPGKPLAMIAGLPMIEHVRRRSLLAKGVTYVVVATCDSEIRRAVESFGGIAVMTSDRHERCTERVAEAASLIDAEIVVNVQGDEPLMFPESITQAAGPLSASAEINCVSLLSPLESETDLENPNVVKAVCRPNGEVFYFSRAPVPYRQKPGAAPVFRETGIRALRSDFLRRYATLPETDLERIESVDMLRVLEHGHRIMGVPTDYATMGVDHEEDIGVVEKLLSDDPLQQRIIREIL
jgi:3-deoxy-manno-octulosonate cytidylyltransferase (CMP-KDO synthetase)